MNQVGHVGRCSFEVAESSCQDEFPEDSRFDFAAVDLRWLDNPNIVVSIVIDQTMLEVIQAAGSKHPAHKKPSDVKINDYIITKQVTPSQSTTFCKTPSLTSLLRCVFQQDITVVSIREAPEYGEVRGVNVCPIQWERLEIGDSIGLFFKKAGWRVLKVNLCLCSDL